MVNLIYLLFLYIHIYQYYEIIGGIDIADDITDYIQWKIQGLCIQADDDDVEG